jgi:hypothetical protein
MTATVVALMLAGESSGVVNPILGGMAFSFVANGGTATAGWRFNTNGSYDFRNQAAYTHAANWFNPSGGTPGNSYWARLTVVSGNTPIGSAVGAWVALSGAVEWRLVAHGAGQREVEFEGTYTIEISSDAGGATIVSSSGVGAFGIDAMMGGTL